MVAFVVLMSGLIAAVAVDIRTRRIPNWLTGAMVGAGFGLSAGGGPVTLTNATLGLFAGLLLMLPGHLIGATGAGDVKLMAAVGTLIGPGPVLKAFLFSAVAGGAIAIVVAAWRGNLASTVKGAGQFVSAPTEVRPVIEAPSRRNRFAYGPAIAVGTLISLMVKL